MTSWLFGIQAIKGNVMKLESDYSSQLQVALPESTGTREAPGSSSAVKKNRSSEAVSRHDFASTELAMTLAAAEIAIDRLREKMESVKDRSVLNKRAQIEQDKRIIEHMEAAAKAAKGGLLAKIFGWVAKILTLAVSAVAVAATGGAASPAMAAALLLASYDIVASAAMEAKQGLQIGLADGLGKFVGVLAKACGANEEQVKQAEQWGGLALSLALQLGIAAAVLAPNAAAKALSKAGDLISSLGQFFVKLGTRSGQVVGESLEALAKSPLLSSFFKRLAESSSVRTPLLDDLAGTSAAVSSRTTATGAAAGAGSRATSQSAASGGEAVGKSAEQTWEDASKWMRAALKLQGPVGALQGATAVTEAGFGIKSGLLHHKAALAEAEAQEATVLLNFLHAFFEKEKQEMDVAARDVSTILKKCGEMIEERADTSFMIAANFGPV
jgi:hypothetical protein